MLVKQFWTREMAFRVTDKKDEFIFFKPSYLAEIHGEEESEGFDIVVTVGAGMPKNKAFVYKLMTELCAGGIISRAEARKYLVQQFGLPLAPQMPEDIQGEVKARTAMNPEIEGAKDVNKE